MDSPSHNQHKHYMRMALAEAEQALTHGDIPIGAVIVSQGKVIARAHNQTVLLNDPTAHAEMIAMSSAASYMQGRYLKECTLYVTLEPCTMCAGASFWAQIDTIVYGAHDPKRGFAAVAPAALHPKTRLIGGIMAEECQQLLLAFFHDLRNG
jgi:tRNA(adenine34) deaminase